MARQENGRHQAKMGDVNGDLVLSSAEQVVRGFLADACTNFRGRDSVVVVP